MQLNLSDIPFAFYQPPWTGEPAKLWLEEEDPGEIEKVEYLKKKQRELEKRLSEERQKQQQEQKEKSN